MKLETIVAELKQLKGSGCWKRIATASGTDYTTIARIARGDMPNPGVLTCERIADAILAEKAGPPSGPDAAPVDTAAQGA
jgi:hypothetical protein